MKDPREWPCTDDAPIHNGNGNYFDYEPTFHVEDYDNQEDGEIEEAEST